MVGGERQGRVTGCAADLIEHRLAQPIRLLHRRIVWNDAARNGQRGLEQGDRGQVGDRQLVRKTIPIGVGIEPEALFGLHTVVMVERVVAELPQGNYVPYLM